MEFPDRRMKAQPALEFLSVYSWTLLTIIIFIVVATVLVTAQSKQIYPPSHCYITPTLPCYGMYVMTNSLGTSALVIFNNNLGVTLNFPNNAFAVNPTYNNVTYYGQCVPTNAIAGSVVSCNATLTGYSPSLGSELNPFFLLSYSICGTTCSGSLPIYNTTGSSELTVSQLVTKQFRNFVELVNPAGYGTVTPGNETYNYGTQVTITATNAIGHTFIGWTCSGVGCYSGTATSNTLTLSNYIVETANFK